MKKLVAVLAAFLLPSVALATCTWTSTSNTAKAVCTTADEAIPTAATDGLALNACSKGIAVLLEADATKTLSGTGNIKL